jgi:hypothetical protein
VLKVIGIYQNSIITQELFILVGSGFSCETETVLSSNSMNCFNNIMELCFKKNTVVDLQV